MIKKVKRRIEDINKRGYEDTYNILTYEMRNIIKNIHEKYVLTVADKASGNIIISCKKHYLSINKNELLDNDTYMNIDSDTFNNKQNSIKSYCDKYNINCNVNDISYQYSNYKMHKEPVGNRFILASAKCSLKGISSMLVIALKKIMKARRSYCNTIYNSNRINTMWVIDNNMKLIDELNSLSTNKKAVTIQTFDFERLYIYEYRLN
jgi:hypothetical protein